MNTINKQAEKERLTKHLNKIAPDLERREFSNVVENLPLPNVKEAIDNFSYIMGELIGLSYTTEQICMDLIENLERIIVESQKNDIKNQIKRQIGELEFILKQVN